MRLARLERLMARRPLLLSSVLLRQNPHNVDEWHKRVALYGDDKAMVQQMHDILILCHCHSDRTSYSRCMISLYLCHCRTSYSTCIISLYLFDCLP